MSLLPARAVLACTLRPMSSFSHAHAYAYSARPLPIPQGQNQRLGQHQRLGQRQHLQRRALSSSRPVQADAAAVDPLPQSSSTRAPADPAPKPTSGAPHTPVMDVVERGTEDGAVVAAEVVSGAPAELQYRQVRIFKPTKSTMQSAKGKTRRWILDWDVLPGAGRWENPLMGWASSADYMQGTSLAFRSRDAAVAFAEKQGWNYIVSEPKVAKIPPKNYASNYVHIPGKLRIHHTK